MHHPLFAIAECIYITNRKRYFQNVVCSHYILKIPFSIGSHYILKIPFSIGYIYAFCNSK